MERNEIVKALFAPFSVEFVNFRVGNKVRKDCGAGLAFFNVYLYIDKETIQDRLDEIVGPFGWAASYNCMNEGAYLYMCDLKIEIDGLECVKQGVGGPGDQMKNASDKAKSAMTGAFRAASGEWGFDRNLDRLPQIIWAGVVKDKDADKFSYWQDEDGLRKVIHSLITKEAAGQLSPTEARRTIWWSAKGNRTIAMSPEPEDMPVEQAPASAQKNSQARPPAPMPPPVAPAPVESIFEKKAKAFVAARQVFVIEPGQSWNVGIETVGQQIQNVKLIGAEGGKTSFCACMDFFEGRQNDKAFQCAHTLAVRYFAASQSQKQKAS